jgi:CubicO group peptidase (beta-lactamase class C family)
MQKNLSSAGSSPQLQGLDEFVRGIMQDWHAPGVALAVIKENKVIYTQGFGQRDTAQNLPVTPETLFPIASCTKAFTAASLSILADQGKLDWDTPVRAYIPSFKLFDPFASERATARDLISHRTGLPRHDLVWYHNTTITRQELFERLQYLEPTKDFRTFWQYQNLMFMAAGHLVEIIAGQSWEEFVQQNIFQPLDMRASNFDITQTVKENTNYSHPYQEKNEKIEEMPFYAAQAGGAPAGAIVSNITEMSNWVLMQLNQGRYQGKQIISEAQLTQMHTPQMVIPEGDQYAEMPYESYAMGWRVTTYQGHPMVTHSGGIDGFRSRTTLFPREHIGIIVLANLNQLNIPEMLTFNVFERLVGLDQIPWSARFMQAHLALKQARHEGQEQKETKRVAGTNPSHPLAAYTGDFAHPGYGTLSVTLHAGALQAVFNEMTLPIQHYHYDIFEFFWEQLQEHMKFSFLTSIKGDIDTLVAPFEPTGNDIVFKRVPNKAMQERSFLEQFLGVYELLEMRFVVSLKTEHQLSITFPGQPEYELEPYRGSEFLVKGPSDTSIEFQRDATGKVTALDATASGSVFHANRKV